MRATLALHGKREFDSGRSAMLSVRGSGKERARGGSKSRPRGFRSSHDLNEGPCNDGGRDGLVSARHVGDGGTTGLAAQGDAAGHRRLRPDVRAGIPLPLDAGGPHPAAGLCDPASGPQCQPGLFRRQHHRLLRQLRHSAADPPLPPTLGLYRRRGHADPLRWLPGDGDLHRPDRRHGPALAGRGQPQHHPQPLYPRLYPQARPRALRALQGGDERRLLDAWAPRSASISTARSAMARPSC